MSNIQAIIYTYCNRKAWSAWIFVQKKEAPISVGQINNHGKLRAGIHQILNSPIPKNFPLIIDSTRQCIDKKLYNWIGMTMWSPSKTGLQGCFEANEWRSRHLLSNVRNPIPALWNFGPLVWHSFVFSWAP